jgi:hypothetical protein
VGSRLRLRSSLRCFPASHFFPHYSISSVTVAHERHSPVPDRVGNRMGGSRMVSKVSLLLPSFSCHLQASQPFAPPELRMAQECGIPSHRRSLPSPRLQVSGAAVSKSSTAPSRAFLISRGAASFECNQGFTGNRMGGSRMVSKVSLLLPSFCCHLQASQSFAPPELRMAQE